MLGYLDTVSLFSKTVGTTEKELPSWWSDRSLLEPREGDVGWSLESIVSPGDVP